jgi:hypothetical protein
MSRLWTTPEEGLFKDLAVILAVQPTWVEPLVKAFGAAGGSPVIIDQEEEGIPLFRLRQPSFFILSEGFGEGPSRQNPLLDLIQKMPAGQRREMFVVWISSKINSGDSFSAFSYSVNLVLSPEKLVDILDEIKKSWLRWREMYQVFIETRLRIIGP